MGVAMAGMLVSGLHTLPAGTWEGVFAAGAAWFGGQTLRARRKATASSPWRCLHAAPHLVECAAMLYMFLLLPAARNTAARLGAMTGSPNESGFSFLALLMALFLLGYVVWLGDRLTVRTPGLALAGQLPAASTIETSGSAASSPAATGCAGTAPGRPAPGRPAPGRPAPGRPAPGRPAPGRPHLAPRCAVLCKIAMGITMGYMLILML